jgi:hypothetical protein
MISRAIDINQHLQPNKVLIIYGARQVGKTTLVKKFLKETNLKHLFHTGDEIPFAQDMAKCDLNLLHKMLDDVQLLVIDEAQKIPNIGRALKLIVDNLSGIRVIATGSSAFTLANKTGESLTGRKNILTLYPISCYELNFDSSLYQLERNLSDFLRFGMYPNILELDTYQQKEQRIKEIKDSYLLQDILEFKKIKGSQVIIDLLKHIAFQIGSEVSTSELASKVGVDSKTIRRYLDLLEKSFVLFRLGGFSRNLRKEISKMDKYYFYDIGIRNALISNFNDLDTRNDIGQLWENFILLERLKLHEYQQTTANYYFWRTYDQKEIDLIEERNAKLYGYEFKAGQKRPQAPKDWLENYNDAEYEVINRDNYLDFIT